jgi:hypothetical protein
MTLSIKQLDAILNPPGRRSLNTVIASLETIERRLVTPDVVELHADDLRTLLAAARLGRNAAEEEIARCWGSFG